MNIKVIGIGGIGGCLLPVLCRYLTYEAPSARVTLVDGDNFEEHNASRQSFHRVGNKAEVTSEQLRTTYRRLSIEYIAQYVSEGNVVEFIREDDIVLLCVDNHATRKLVSDRCGELVNTTLISGGNDLHDGNVQVYQRRNEEDITLPLASKYHPEILHPKDKNPTELGCEERAQSEPQVLVTNNAIASTMLAVFYLFSQKGIVGFDEIYVDLLTGNSRSVYRTAAPI